MERGADISECGLYRYTLWCRWGPGDRVNFCCLNPSTADATINDASFTRMMRFALDWGFNGVVVTNLFAFRATNPAVMLAASDPVGPRNDSAIRRAASRSALVVAGWGNWGHRMNRGEIVRTMVPGLHHLGLTLTGHPKHPLYLRSDLRPQPWAL